jgi:hypothetical protein
MEQHFAHAVGGQPLPVGQGCVAGQGGRQIGRIRRQAHCRGERGEQLAFASGQQRFAVVGLGYRHQEHDLGARLAARNDAGGGAAVVEARLGEPPVAEAREVPRPARPIAADAWARGGGGLVGWGGSHLGFQLGLRQPALRFVVEDVLDPGLPPPRLRRSDAFASGGDERSAIAWS